MQHSEPIKVIPILYRITDGKGYVLFPRMDWYGANKLLRFLNEEVLETTKPGEGFQIERVEEGR